MRLPRRLCCKERKENWQSVKQKSYVKKLRQFVDEAQEEALSLAEEVVHLLKEFPPQPLEADNALSMIERWETIEAISAALQVCLQV